MTRDRLIGVLHNYKEGLLSFEDLIKRIDEYADQQTANMYSEEEVCNIIQSLKDYTIESGIALGHDKREPIDFLNIYNAVKKLKSSNH